VLVTGASRGIGRATAARLAAEGFRVFGTSRSPQSEVLDGFSLLQLDVTVEESVAACIAEVIARAGRIDVLVSNAGVDLVGAAEECSLEDAQWLFDTNFFGAARMIKAALPGMRARRDGQIILISSALGRASFPFESFYCASKAALEAYAESLRYEMNIFNVRVSTVQPGYFRTEIARHQRIASDRLPAYDGPRERFIYWNNFAIEHAPEPTAVADKVLAVIQQDRPRLRHPVGLEAKLAPPLAHLLPEAILIKGGRLLLGVDDPRRELLRLARAGAVGTAALALAVSGLRRLRARLS
jgi:NAD(P)-dependent dehydrogenase (short-subunit alcohol dehydrogenase family)